MNRKGFTLVEIMIVVAIIALLSSIAIPNLLAARRTANEAAARATVRSLFTAAESFSVLNNGAYPSSVAQLTAYISSAGRYCADAEGGGTEVQGYSYSCDLSPSQYTFTAIPVTPEVTGSFDYIGTTGAVLLAEASSEAWRRTVGGAMQHVGP